MTREPPRLRRRRESKLRRITTTIIITLSHGRIGAQCGIITTIITITDEATGDV
jgi:hypothetical protein